jgi:hypothetical protein
MDDLLFGRLQVAGRLRLRAQALHRIHHCRLLIRKRVTKLLCPVEVAVQQRQNRREWNQRFDARVPGLRLQGFDKLVAGQRLMGRFFDPTPCTDNLQRERRGHKDLSQQRIGIERDRRQERIKLF